MIDQNKVTKDEPAAPRILARQLARPLTDDEIGYVAGGMMSRGETGDFSTSGARHSPGTYSVCPGNDADA
jgi:hypothetical protein